MDSQLSVIYGKYKVKTITGDEFDVIYTASAGMVDQCLATFKRMFQESDEWVAGLDVEYTYVREPEKFLKEEKKKKPAVIQVCVQNLCLVYHIHHADVPCEQFKLFLLCEKVKFVTVDFTNDKRVLGRIGLTVGNPFDLQKKNLVSSEQPSLLTLAGAMIDPSYRLQNKPGLSFHQYKWEWDILDPDHIKYAALDAYLCLNIYKGWMKRESQVSSSSKELSAKRKRDQEEDDDVDEDDE